MKKVTVTLFINIKSYESSYTSSLYPSIYFIQLYILFAKKTIY